MSADPQTDAPRKTRSGRTLRMVLLVVIPAVFVFAGAAFYYSGGRYVTTENAYVKAPIISVVSQVAGRVAAVHVAENQVVEAGETLLELDQSEFALAVKEAEANLASVAQDIENRRAELRQAQAEIRIAQERRRYLEAQYAREQKLAQKNIGLQMKLDEAQHNLRAAERSLVAATERKSGILAMLGGNPDMLTTDHPKYSAALARLNRARLDLERSVIKAPVAGVVAKMNLDPGEYIKSEDPLFAIVQTGKAWIEANLKETELTHVRPGQQATFIVDAYPDTELKAEVIGISPATGAEFAVLPPQNASGNWVKVVQRLPVRLTIEDGEAHASSRLRAGMTVTVSIDTGHERKAPPFISQVLAATRTIVGSPQQK